ncbi:MAG: hypothetical protein IKO28_03180 [Prevotella sp.]|nr:hypothetical protein [Prevotella sp.]
MKKEKLNKLIKEMTNNPQSLVDITLNDVRDLFLEGREIHDFDTSVNASIDGRMERIMDKVKRTVMVSNGDIRLLFYLFFPENLPLMMHELSQFTQWIDTIPGSYTIKWGMAKHSAQELRTLILWQ